MNRTLSRLSTLVVTTATVASLSACGHDAKGSASGTLAVSAEQLTSGVWAKQMILASESSAAGITSTSKIERLLLVKVTKNGDQLDTTEELCDITSTASRSNSLVFPDAFKRSLAPRTVAYKLSAAGNGVQLATPAIVEVLGANLSDAAGDGLPGSRSDERVTDQDGDGQPGMTVNISARALFINISGRVYITQRTITKETGIASSADLVKGSIEWSIEQNILGSDSTILGSVSPSITPIMNQSQFTMRKLGDDATCDTVNSRRDEMFARPN